MALLSIFSSTGGPPLTLFFGTAEKTVLEGKTVLEEEFLSTIYYKNGTAEFLRKKRVREKSTLEEDRVRGGPPVQYTSMQVGDLEK